MLATKSNSYTFQKDGVWYFSREVPADLRRHYRTGRIAYSLRTKSIRVRFTGHLARYTQSKHLIGLRRKTALNSIRRMPPRYRTALSCITLLFQKLSDWIEQRRFFKRSRWSNAPDGHSRITHARSKRIRQYTKYHFTNDNWMIRLFQISYLYWRNPTGIGVI